jgi:hypothetical protein
MSINTAGSDIHGHFFLCSRFVETPIMPTGVAETLQASGLDFARAEDAGAAAIRIAADKSIHGKYFFHAFELSCFGFCDRTNYSRLLVGRSLGIVPRKWAPAGYMDLNNDDVEDGTLWNEFQEEVLTFPRRLGVRLNS